MFDRVLVVCVGNICRSPYGEHVLRKHFPNKKVASAGIGVTKSGLENKPADNTAIEISKVRGIDLAQHCTQQLTSELCSNYDLILVMEKGHIKALNEIAPEARGKTMLFGEWIGKKDIPDPYKQSKEAFEHAYKMIEQAADAWARKL